MRPQVVNMMKEVIEEREAMTAGLAAEALVTRLVVEGPAKRAKNVV